MIGIYSITNIITNEVYIGQSLSIYQRWGEHLVELESNSHHSNKLQESFNKYGATAFNFRVIELIPISHREIKRNNQTNKMFNILLTVRESYYMNKYNSLNNGFNIVKSIHEDILQYSDLLIDNNLLNDSICLVDISKFINSDTINTSSINEEHLKIMLDKLPLCLDKTQDSKDNIKIDCSMSEISLGKAIYQLPDFFHIFTQSSIYNIFKNEHLIYKNVDMTKYSITKENDYLYLNKTKTVCVTKQGLRFIKNKLLDLLLSDEELQLIGSTDKIVYPLL